MQPKLADRGLGTFSVFFSNAALPYSAKVCLHRRVGQLHAAAQLHAAGVAAVEAPTAAEAATPLWSCPSFVAKQANHGVRAERMQ